jgi:hypothetical protein
MDQATRHPPHEHAPDHLEQHDRELEHEGRGPPERERARHEVGLDAPVALAQEEADRVPGQDAQGEDADQGLVGVDRVVLEVPGAHEHPGHDGEGDHQGEEDPRIDAEPRPHSSPTSDPGVAVSGALDKGSRRGGHSSRLLHPCHGFGQVLPEAETAVSGSARRSSPHCPHPPVCAGTAAYARQRGPEGPLWSTALLRPRPGDCAGRSEIS